jgi:hypothetical protein
MIKNLGYWKYTKIILFIFILLISCSCVFHEQYPSNWAPLATPSKDCLAIMDTYKMENSFLFYFLTGIVTKSPDPDIDYIKITKEDNDVLLVMFWRENKKFIEKIYKKDDYACTNEGLVISKGVKVTNNWVLGLERNKIMLMKATDNSLVVQYEFGGFGLFGALVPVADDEIEYYKYSQKK